MSKAEDSYPPVLITVDVVLMALVEGDLKVLVMKRPNAPFEGRWALPGGYVHTNEDDDSAASARRVLQTKLDVEPPYLEQLSTFADGVRDPRGWSASIAYFALVGLETLEQAVARGDDQVRLISANALPPLAFDHTRIAQAAVKRLHDKSAYSTLPCYLAGDKFTLSYLQSLYEAAMGTRLEKAHFRRKLDELKILEVCEGEFLHGAGRPAQLYRLTAAAQHQLAFFKNPLA